MQIDEASFLQRCKDLAGDTSEGQWTPDHMAGFFQKFRPDGRQLESLFKDIPAGLEIYSRLRQVFLATADDYQRPQSYDGYFIIHNPEPLSLDNLTQHATQQLLNWRHMAAGINEQELVALLTPIPEVEIRYSNPPERDPNDTESLDVFIYDVQSDWHSELEASCPHSWWMREAFYYIACDYDLSDYITWPWYEDSSSIKEPYEPYFNLWLHGAEFRCNTPENIVLYVMTAEQKNAGGAKKPSP